ncbi:hypothetical protein L218DRAFT_1074315 [Marasmius fiardii PR-910]|nr:hypothetical protein L218DRAFT_1074315 [Marasmius fiardii PR-910]
MSRFKNPHLQPLGTKTVSRYELFLDHKDDGDSVSHSHYDNQGRLELLNQLNETIEASFQFKLSSFEDEAEPVWSKRRKLAHEGEYKEEMKPQEPLPALRLISDQQVVSISLEPRPSKPPRCYRGREYEDDQQTAGERRQRAQSVAVDIEWLIQESKIPYQLLPRNHGMQSRRHS